MAQGFISSSGLILPLALNQGGTGATTAAGALTNFGVTTTAAKLNLLTNTAQTLVQHLYTQSGAVATGTGVIPFDDTIPQNTEGDQYFSLTITPKSATNILKIVFDGYGSSSVATANFVIAVFQDSNVNALAANNTLQQVATGGQHLTLVHNMVAGTTSATTFKIRIGSAGTFTLNGYSSARCFGGVSASSLAILEYTP